MPELELFVALRDTTDSGAVHFMNFVTGLFAFVVASHFTARELSRVNLGILVGAYSAFSLLTGAAAYTRFRASGIIVEQLMKLPDPTARALVAPFVGAPMVANVASLVLVAGYLAGIAFLVETRRK